MNNERTLSPKDAMRLTKAMIQMKKPVFLHGPPGIGKSDMIREIGKELGRDVYDIRLLLMGETDIRGLPHYNSDSKKMEWAPPSAFPLEKDSNAIIFLDEITQATPSVQAAALQLVLDRQIGEFKLGDEVAIVAAGNRSSDRTGAKPLIKALANRFLHINVEARFKDWQKYAMETGVHADVVGFLSHKTQYMNNFDPSDPSNAFATPRTWVFFVSDILKAGIVPDDLLHDAVSGAVGEAIALEFMSVRKILTKLPHPDDVLSGKVTKLDYKEIAAQYSIVTSINYRLSELLKEKKADGKVDQDWYGMADNFLKFANDNLEPEITVMALSVAIGNFRMPFNHTKMPNYKAFYTKYQHLLSGIY
jgi:hypothetical protein